MSLMPIFSPVRSVNVSYIGLVQDASDLTTYTFTGANIGGPGLIVVIAHSSGSGGAARTLSSLTIGGVTANIISNSNPSFSDPSVIAYLRVSSGTTANIVATWSGGMSRCGISVFRITGNSNDAPYHAPASVNSSSASALNISLNIPSGAGAVFGAGNSYNGAGVSFTWTNVTKDYDATLDSGAGYLEASGGHHQKYVGSTPLSVTATANHTSQMSMSAASWI